MYKAVCFLMYTIFSASCVTCENEECKAQLNLYKDGKVMNLTAEGKQILTKNVACLGLLEGKAACYVSTNISLLRDFQVSLFWICLLIGVVFYEIPRVKRKKFYPYCK